LDYDSHPVKDELVPSRYALRIGEIDVLVVSDGVLTLPGAMLAHNAERPSGGLAGGQFSWAGCVRLGAERSPISSPPTMVHVHVSQHHVSHGRKIDAGGLQSVGQLSARATGIPLHPGVRRGWSRSPLLTRPRSAPNRTHPAAGNCPPARPPGRAGSALWANIAPGNVKHSIADHQHVDLADP